MSLNPLKIDDMVELVKERGGFKPGSRGRVYATAGDLIGITFDDSGASAITAGNFNIAKKLTSSKLFPVKYRIVK